MTPERFARLRQVLDRRQPDLTVLMDNVHKPHNLSAVLRSCDAVGVLEAHAVWPGARLRPQHDTSGGTGKWVPIVTHPDLPAACAALKAEGSRVVAAHRGKDAVDYQSVDYTRPTALLLGAELTGVSEQGLALADQRIVIPMLGMVHSLNVSVAAAIMLAEARRQRQQAGLYDSPRLAPARYRSLLFEWAHPKVAAWCRRHEVDYPPLDEHGDIIGSSWRV
ncbi:MAG: tRNA (guanosine(18)-2'-O)-methyltransferase TrmH [Gammaproteobacteria bacterium]